MKHFLLCTFFVPFFSPAQYNVAYTVTITKLMARADDCDGGAPFCLNAPQDPVFNIWTNDGEANENTSCWIFEDDPEIEYGLWKDIQNLEIANESGVNTSYITFDMAGFESDAIGSPGCTSGTGDDAVHDRQFVEQFDLSTIPAESTYVDTINLNDVYYAQIEIWWEDLNAGLFELDDDLVFALGPNPSSGVFDIRLSEGSVPSFDVIVTDIAGRVIYEHSEHGNQLTVDLNGQTAGMYFVKLSSEGKSATQTLILN